MIESREEMKMYIREDAKANRITSRMRYYVKLLYGNVNAVVFRYLKSLRKYEYYTNIKSPLRYVYRIYNRRLGLKYNLAIPINVVGYGLYIPHIEGGVIINARRIGNHCTINSGVVVGANHNNTEIAEIGDNCVLCVGCKVIGRINVGNDVIVAPNSVVIKDVLPNSVVSGVPAAVIKINGQKV